MSVTRITPSHVVLAVLVLGTALLTQVALAGPVGGSGADLVLVAVVAIALAHGPGVGTVAGFCVGLAVDLAPPAAGPAGRTALALSVAGYLAGVLAGWAERSWWRTGVVVVGAAVLVPLLAETAAFLAGDPRATPGQALAGIGGALVIDLLLAAALVPLVRLVRRRILDRP